MVHVLTQLNNQYVEIDGLIDRKTKFLGDGVTLNPNPTFINNGTGTVSVKDPSNALIIIGPAGATTTPAVYVAGSNGDYFFQITSVFNPPTLGQGYTVIIDLTAPGGFIGHAELPAQLKVGNLQ